MGHRALLQINHDVVGALGMISSPRVERERLVQNAPEPEWTVHVAPKRPSRPISRETNVPRLFIPVRNTSSNDGGLGAEWRGVHQPEIIVGSLGNGIAPADASKSVVTKPERVSVEPNIFSP